MILQSYDPHSPAVFSPADFYGEGRHLCDVCVVTFSHEIYAHAIEAFPCVQIAETQSCNGATPLFLLTVGEQKIALYLSHIGAACAGADVIECHHLTGATQFIMFGSAGNLNRQATEGRFIVPTEAYRDEGTSYHYAPPADYIAVPGAAFVSQVFDALKIPYVQGRVWTTDAPYRETRDQVARRQCEGCLAVEMELSGVQAVCDFYGLSLYDFLIAGDVLDAPAYIPDGLQAANHTLTHFAVALEIAKRLAS